VADPGFSVAERGRPDAMYAGLAIAVLLIMAVPVGGAVFVLGFLHGDSPCVMCWEQRIGMILLGLLGLFILRYGPRPRYIGVALLVSAYGIFMGTRHVASHAARDIGQGFSVPILGVHTYTWSLAVFWLSVVIIALLVMVLRPEPVANGPRTLTPLGRAAAAVFLVVAAANVVQAFASTGPPPFAGQSDPVRFSFNPRHWVWSLGEWRSARISLRGRWAVEPPGSYHLVTDPSAGPLGTVPILPVLGRRSVGFPLDGAPTDLAWNEATSQVLITTTHGIYLADSALQTVERYTIVDPGFSVDLGAFGGAAFVNDGDVMAVTENKSYVILRPDDAADADANFRYFLESADRFREVARSRFTTVRARMFHVASLAADPASHSVYTITVPNNQSRRLILSRFDLADRTLSEEFVPALAPGSGLLLGEGRTLHEYFVTGATVVDGMLYAVSANYGALLVIDLGRHAVTAAYAIDNLSDPVGIAAHGGQLWILERSGNLSIIDRPGS